MRLISGPTLTFGFNLVFSTNSIKKFWQPSIFFSGYLQNLLLWILLDLCCSCDPKMLPSTDGPPFNKYFISIVYGISGVWCYGLVDLYNAVRAEPASQKPVLR